MRIGDLVENAGVVANVPIFRAPDLGPTGTVSADAVVEAVRPHALIGLDTGGVSEVAVTRASRTIPAKDIEDRVAQALAAQYALGQAKDIARDVRPRADARSRSSPAPRATRASPHLNYDSAQRPLRGHARHADRRHHARRAAACRPRRRDRRGRHRWRAPLERGEVIKAADVVVERRPRAEIGRERRRSTDAGGRACRAQRVAAGPAAARAPT